MKRKPFVSGIPSSEITPEALYVSRRKFLRVAALAGVSAALSACGVGAPAAPTAAPAATANTPAAPTGATAGAAQVTGQLGLKDELGDPATGYEEITNYNNFYEFSLGKELVAGLAQKLVTSPWTVEVGGLVNKPATLGMEDILQKYPAEERVYRMRCVEGWSMVIPWSGFPLADLLADVEPQASAKYVKFTSAAIEEQMPGLGMPFFPWPYTEGLRLDEAMNDLTLLATGLYGKPLPNQDGAPIRLVVPWKYGFKSAKSLVKIELVAEQPATFWNISAPDEYGFYSNVNPDVPHPRWSQSTERRIGEGARRKTLLFNGYAEQVAALYEGMDLARDY